MKITKRKLAGCLILFVLFAIIVIIGIAAPALGIVFLIILSVAAFVFALAFSIHLLFEDRK